MKKRKIIIGKKMISIVLCIVIMICNVSFFSMAKEDALIVEQEEERASEQVEKDVAEQVEEQPISVFDDGILSTTRSTDTIVYWNPDPVSKYYNEIWIPGGSDSNSGLESDAGQIFPVLTWEAVKSILGDQSGTVIVMNPIIVGEDIFPVDYLDGEGKVFFTQWNKLPNDIFIIPPGETFTLKNIFIRAESSLTSMIRIVESTEGVDYLENGRLVIDKNVYFPNGGFIQIETDPYKPGHITRPSIQLLWEEPLETYRVYFSGINDNQVFNCVDFIEVPGDADNYLEYFTLSSQNNEYGWNIRKDEDNLDSDGDNPNHIEIYRKFIYEGIYINGQTGNDNYFGGNCRWPVKTFKRAKEILDEHLNDIDEKNRIIKVCDTIDIIGEEDWSLPEEEYGPYAKVLTCDKIDSLTGHTAITTLMVRIDEGGKLKTNNITIQNGITTNSGDILIQVQAGGSYICESNTVLTGASNFKHGYGVVVNGAVDKHTTFTMNGGTIRNRLLGVRVNGAGISNTYFYMNGGQIMNNGDSSNTANMLHGAGVYINNTRFDMTGGTIEDNYSRYNSYYGYGGGIYIAGASLFNMSGGSICKNQVYCHSSSSSYAGYGGGIYVGTGGKVNISGNADISENSINYGWGGGIYLEAGTELNISGGIIQNNKIKNSSASTGRGGGGICSYGKVTMTGGTIYRNTVPVSLGSHTIFGGGIYMMGTLAQFSMSGGFIKENLSGGTFSYGGGIALKGLSNAEAYRTYITGGIIEGNSAYYGGGIYFDAGTLSVENDARIAGNSAENGGALYHDSGTAYLLGGNIEQNQTMSKGGGIYNDSAMYMDGCSIKNNQSLNGGGIYNAGTFHINGGNISENKASGYGGGIYSNAGTFAIDSGTFIKNEAEAGGASAYIASTAYFSGGTFSSELNGTDQYGIYINIPVNASSTTKAFIAPENIDLQDRIFLNTVPSALFLLNAVSTKIEKLSISVNKENFGVGSVVVVPANVGNVTIYKNIHKYENLKDVTPYISYFTGDVLPKKTQLGSFNKNIVLVGEGVYLDGEKGLDTNSGTSPEDALKTFAAAKRLLKESIENAADKGELPLEDPRYDPDGFEPFIYICGKVNVPANIEDQNWNLDYDSPELDQRKIINSEGNIVNEERAQIRRFGSYYGVMVEAKDSGAEPFTIGKLLMDGCEMAIDALHNTTVSEMIRVLGGNVIMEADAQVINNYSDGVLVNSGMFIMKGNNGETKDGIPINGALLSSHRKNALHVKGGIAILEGDASIVQKYKDISTRGIYMLGTSSNTGRVIMRGNSSITLPDTNSYYAVHLAGHTVDIGNNVPHFWMKDNAQIRNATYGIYNASKANNDEVILLSDNAQIVGGKYGVILLNQGILNMEDYSKIIDNEYAVYIDIQGKVNMDGYAQIEKNNHGVYIYNGTNVVDQCVVSMSGNSKITDSISHAIYIGARTRSFTLNMDGNSRITKSGGVGVLNDVYTQDSSYVGTVTYNLGGNACIGGDNPLEGNNLSNSTSIKGGIVDRCQGKLIMTGNARISYNNGPGVNYTRNYTYTVTNQHEIELHENARINNNTEEGISNKDYVSGSITYYDITSIRLRHNANIKENGKNGILLGFKSTLWLEGLVVIDENNAKGDSRLLGSSIDAMGKIYLGGSVKVNGEIYLRNENSPISLTSTIPENNIFHLGYYQGFIDQIIVMPEGEITDTTPYGPNHGDNFRETDNIPEGKIIIEMEPNLVIMGNPDIYIAGDGPVDMENDLYPGRDTNSGRSPGAPVRTFRRAKEILYNSPKGANIIICNYTVNVGSGMNDFLWSFNDGEDGRFTNARGESWYPKVIRMDEFDKVMIAVGTNVAAAGNGNVSLEFRDIIIDGNKDAFPSGCRSMLVNGYSTGKTITIGPGTTLQNNRTSNAEATIFYNGSTSYSFNSGFYTNSTCITYAAIANVGTINMTGGAIRGMETVIAQNILSTTTDRELNGGIVANYGHASTYPVFRMTGGVIEQNTIGDTERNHYLQGGIFGTTYWSISDSYIPRIYISGNAVIKDNKIINGGQINGGIASHCVVTMSGSSVIQNNEIRSNTGSVYGGIFNSYDIKVTENASIFENSAYAYTEARSMLLNVSGRGSALANACELSGTASIQGNTLKAGVERGSTISTRANQIAYGMIYVPINMTMVFSGGRISGNSIHGHVVNGGAIYYNGQLDKNYTSRINGTVILDNICDDTLNGTRTDGTSRGSGIYMAGGHLRISIENMKGNRARQGAAIYYGSGNNDNSKLEIAGGIFSDNRPLDATVQPIDVRAGIYVGGRNFYLRGGNPVIEDRIYLSSNSYQYRITLSGSIYQRNRLYKVDVASNYTKGAIIVQPDNDVIIDASQYLKYFEVQKTGYLLERDAPNLTLKQYFFIDSVKGLDTNSGSNPDHAVKTFARVKELSAQSPKDAHIVIYVSGEVYPNTANEIWTLPETSWVCRYTGFSVTGTEFPAFMGHMIVTGKNGSTNSLTLDNIKVYGRRFLDGNSTGGSAICKIGEGTTLTISQDTRLYDNYTGINGVGGAVHNEGTLHIKGGTISGMSAYIGSAIYQNGDMNIEGSPFIEGEVYLEGNGTDEEQSKYIRVVNFYTPFQDTRLRVNVRNAYNGRRVVQYTDGTIPEGTQKSYFNFPASIMAIYEFGNRDNDKTILELQEKPVVYLDGVNGIDSNSGNSPGKAVRTIKEAFYKLSLMGKGGLILVVDEVTITDRITISNKTFYGNTEGIYNEGRPDSINALGPVAFQRYIQPFAWEGLPDKENYDKADNTGIMFTVSSTGEFITSDISYDGHSQEVIGNPRYAAPGAGASAPIFKIDEGGVLNTGVGTQLLRNRNVQVNGKGAGIWINGGTLKSMSILIDEVETTGMGGKGSAIYQNGNCELNRTPKITGEIHLAGTGSQDNIDDSHYIRITLNGFTPIGGELKITMDDPYPGRPVVVYPNENGAYVPTLEIDIPYYSLESLVTDIYSLGNREGEENVLELQWKHRVYIDGVFGSDSNNGSDPSHSIATLERAYDLLKKYRGGYLYVVNTVTINSEINISSTTYLCDGINETIMGGTVKIRRYMIPDAKENDADFTSPGDNVNPLFYIGEGGELTLENIQIDGHRYPNMTESIYQKVLEPRSAKAPIIQVSTSGILNLNTGAILKNNKNEPAFINGGAISNRGTTNIEGGSLMNNDAAKGSGIYQDGIFTIIEGVNNLNGQEIYLSTSMSGTLENPVWGIDHDIHIREKISDDNKLFINMDHGVDSRNVVVFDVPTAYDITVDNEASKIHLGSTVSEDMYLVKSTDPLEPDTLELHTFEILDVSVPVEMFLMVKQSPRQVTDEILNVPRYTIKNHGIYDVKVSVKGFENKNSSEGITWDQMTLVDSVSDLETGILSEQLYLAIASGDKASDNLFADIPETSLASIINGNPLTLGTLQPKQEGRFTFVGQAKQEFFDKYYDPDYDSDMPDLLNYLRLNARAKYRMIYRFELLHERIMTEG